MTRIRIKEGCRIEVNYRTRDRSPKQKHIVSRPIRLAMLCFSFFSMCDCHCDLKSSGYVALGDRPSSSMCTCPTIPFFSHRQAPWSVPLLEKRLAFSRINRLLKFDIHPVIYGHHPAIAPLVFIPAIVLLSSPPGRLNPSVDIYNHAASRPQGPFRMVGSRGFRMAIDPAF